MCNFESTELTPHNVIPRRMYAVCRPTVSVVLVHNKKITLVQPSADTSGKTWILPQGGIKNDESILEATRRELGNELDVTIESEVAVLGKYLNKLPRHRNEKPKVMIAVAARITSPVLQVNEENRAAIWASDQHNVFYQIGHRMEERRDKVIGMLESIQRAYLLGWINWSCEETLDTVRNYTPEMVVA